MQPRALFLPVDDEDDAGATDMLDAELSFASRYDDLLLDLERMRAEGELLQRAASERLALNLREQDDHEFELAEARARLERETTADLLEYSHLESQDEREFMLAESCARELGVAPAEVFGLAPLVGDEAADDLLAVWDEMQAERQQRIALQDGYEHERAAHARDALLLREAKRELAAHVRNLRERLASTLAAKQRLEAQVAGLAEHERAQGSARLALALAEQRAELEQGFKAKAATAARQRAERDAQAFRQQSIAAARGASRGDAVALELRRLAAKSAL